MALTPQQRTILTKVMVPKARKKKDTSGGEAYSQWQDDPGAHWRPPTPPPRVKPRPIPNAKKGKPKPIPNAGPSNNGPRNAQRRNQWPV